VCCLICLWDNRPTVLWQRPVRHYGPFSIPTVSHEVCLTAYTWESERTLPHNTPAISDLLYPGSLLENEYSVVTSITVACLTVNLSLSASPTGDKSCSRRNPCVFLHAVGHWDTQDAERFSLTILPGVTASGCPHLQHQLFPCSDHSSCHAPVESQLRPIIPKNRALYN
jgi:hypothetical protein